MAPQSSSGEAHSAGAVRGARRSEGREGDGTPAAFYDGLMLERLKAIIGRAQPATPPEAVRSFGPADRPITETGVTPDDGGWKIVVAEAGSVRLFEVAEPGVERCLLAYRAELRTADVEGGAFLEVWCRLPGRGEFFSKGLHQKATGTTGWSSHEVSFRLKADQRPDLIRLNLAVEGPGTIWVRNVQLLQTPQR